MKPFTCISITVAICLAILITITSCNNNSTIKSSVPGDTLNSNLCVLYISTDSIKPHLIPNRKLVLNFFVGDSANVFTLEGWAPKDPDGDSYSTPVKLKIGDPTGLKIHKGIFLGDEVIHRSKVDKILLTSKKFLKFIPKDSSGHIIYKLILTEHNYRTPNIDIQKDDDAGYANPTPPRNFNGNN